MIPSTHVTQLPLYWQYYFSSVLLHRMSSHDIHRTTLTNLPSYMVTYMADENSTLSDIATIVDYSYQGTVVGSNTTQESNTDDWHGVFRAYGVFILIAIGICGNVLSCAIFCTCHLRKTPPGRYIIALSIVDSMVLLAEFFIAMELYVDTKDAACKIIYYLRYVFKLASSLLVVAIAVERFILVVFPLKHNVISTTKTAMISIAVITLTSFALCAYALFTLGVTKWNFCSIIMDKYTIYTTVDLVVSVGLGEVIASVIIAILTGVIVKTLTSAAKWRRNTLMMSGTSTNQGQRGGQAQKQVTVMLMSVAIGFIVLKIPYTVIWFVKFTYHHDHVPKLLFVFTDVFYVISVLNYTINFFLYCITGATVRKRMCEILHCKLHENRGASKILHQRGPSRHGIAHSSSGRIDTCDTSI